MQARQLLHFEKGSPEMQSPQLQLLRQKAKKLALVGYQKVLPMAYVLPAANCCKCLLCAHRQHRLTPRVNALQPVAVCITKWGLESGDDMETYLVPTYNVCCECDPLDPSQDMVRGLLPANPFTCA
jgi:hypothetical protein